MMKMTKIFSATCCVSMAIACGSAETSGTVDDLPTVPAPTNAATMELEFAENVIPAGKDVQVCQFLDTVEEDMWITSFRSYQGKHGHHLMLFAAVVNEPVGTVRDCSSAEDMIRFRPVMASERFGYDEFPAGMGLKVKRGTQLVLQQHYVNTTEHDIRVKDVAHLTPMPESEVDTLIGFMGFSDITFSIPPGGQETDLSFDCTMPLDTNLLVLGPHMHEWGVRFRSELGTAGGSMETILDVPQWTADMRDRPVLTKYTKETAKPIRAGDIIRTTCTFKNTRRDSLEFPEEMCATFGYYFPADPSTPEIVCAGDES